MELDDEFMDSYPGFFDNGANPSVKRPLVTSASNMSVKTSKPINTRKAAVLKCEQWSQVSKASFAGYSMYWGGGCTVPSVMDNGKRRKLRRDAETGVISYDRMGQQMWVTDAIDETAARLKEHVISKKRVCFKKAELELLPRAELWELLAPFDHNLDTGCIVYSRTYLVKQVLWCYNTIRLGFYGDHAALASKEKSQSLLAMQYNIKYEHPVWSGDEAFRASIENTFQVHITHKLSPF